MKHVRKVESSAVFHGPAFFVGPQKSKLQPPDLLEKGDTHRNTLSEIR